VTLRRADGRAISLGLPGPNQSIVDLVFRPAATAPDVHPPFIVPCEVLEGFVIPPGDEAFSLADPGKLFGAGVVQWRPALDEVALPGLYRLGFRITTAAGDVETVPNQGAFDLRIE
jgi:hypothetical protein